MEKTTLSFKKLGKKYGVSRQAIHGFSQRRGIKRPKRPRGHEMEGCRLCQKLIQISKKPHSEFISSHTIKKEIGVKSKGQYFFHLQMLRSKGLVGPNFGRIRSKRIERAYAIYLKERIPIDTIGRKVGLKSFHSTIRRHRALGWDVPLPLYVYDGQERSRIRSEIQRRKRR